MGRMTFENGKSSGER